MEQRSDVLTGDQECDDIQNTNGSIVDLDDVYTETAKNNFETQQLDQVQDELGLENESEFSGTEGLNSLTSSRTIQGYCIRIWLIFLQILEKRLQSKAKSLIFPTTQELFLYVKYWMPYSTPKFDYFFFDTPCTLIMK